MSMIRPSDKNIDFTPEQEREYALAQLAKAKKRGCTRDIRAWQIAAIRTTAAVLQQSNASGYVGKAGQS